MPSTRPFPAAPRLPLHLPADESAPIAPAYLAAGVPEELLHGDEVVLILTKPSLWFILLTSFRFMVTTVLLGVLAVQLLAMPSINYVSPPVVAAITVLICLGRLVWAILVWTSHIYMLTDRRIVTIKGVVNVNMVQVSLRKVQRTELYRPWIFRILGIGTIGVATAATNTLDATWVMIGRPILTHEQMVAAIHKVQ
jgi:uncharacterized membrane protein YdbT with pleckstrin-like domain